MEARISDFPALRTALINTLLQRAPAALVECPPGRPQKLLLYQPAGPPLEEIPPARAFQWLRKFPLHSLKEDYLESDSKTKSPIQKAIMKAKHAREGWRADP